MQKRFHDSCITRACASIVLALSSGCAAPALMPQEPGERRHRALVTYLGERSLDELDGTDLEDQPTIGLGFDWSAPGSPVVWEVGLFTSEEDDDIFGFGVDSSTTEVSAGARYPFDVGESAVRPYVGGGLAWIEGEVDLGAIDDDDSSLGLYVHLGADWWVTETFFLGIDYRILRGTDLSMFDTDTDADYDQIALRLGYSF